MTYFTSLLDRLRKMLGVGAGSATPPPAPDPPPVSTEESSVLVPRDVDTPVAPSSGSG